MPSVQNPSVVRTSIVPSTVVTTAGSTGGYLPLAGASRLLYRFIITAFTGTSITYEIQWSFDGTNFFSASPTKDITGAKSATGTTLKESSVKGLYYRLAYTGTITSVTHSLDDIVIACDGGSGFGNEAPRVSILPSQSLTTGTPTAYVAAPPNAARMAVLVHQTAFTGTSATYEIQWSNTGSGAGISADPVDSFTAINATGGAIQEVSVKAPFYRINPTGTFSVSTASFDDMLTAK